MEVILQLPEDAFSAIRKSPEEFAREMRLAAAVKWYELGVVSQSKASEIAGISREEFLTNLVIFNVSPFQETAEEIAAELER